MSPQKENGYTPIANEIFEAFYRCKMNEYERVIVCTIWRKTYGWSKKEDWVSNSQFSKETGILPSHITRTIKQLIKKCVVNKNGKKLSINKHYHEWKVEWRKLPLQVTNVTSTGNKMLPLQVPTKAKSKLQKQLPEQSSEALNLKTNDMSWKSQRYAEDYELEPIQTDPDHKAKRTEKKMPDNIQQVFDLFSNPAKVTWRLRELERVAAQALYDTYGLETLKKRINRIEAEKKINGDDKFFPLVNTPSTLLDKMEAVERYLKI